MKTNEEYIDNLLEQYEFPIDTEPSKTTVKKRLLERIPARFLRAKLEEISSKLKKYAEKFEKKNQGIYLLGPVGCGKTHSVYAIAINLIIRGFDVKIYKLPRLLNSIRSSFSKKETKNNFEHNITTIEEISNVDVLIIDDIGVERPTEWVLEQLYNIIDTRYENMKTTIFTSNYDLNDLADKTSDRIVSRILEMTDVFSLDGKDKRHKSKQ